MKYLIVFLLLLVTNSFAQDVYPTNIADNIHLRLVAARMVALPGTGAKEHLWAKFRPDDERSRKILVEFPDLPNGEYQMEFNADAAHALSAHEATLINVIRSCILWKNLEADQDHHRPPAKWDPVKFDLVLSIPRPIHNGEIVNYDRWLILSLDERKGD